MSDLVDDLTELVHLWQYLSDEQKTFFLGGMRALDAKREDAVFDEEPTTDALRPFIDLVEGWE
jgi:hypothetical protein